MYRHGLCERSAAISRSRRTNLGLTGLARLPHHDDLKARYGNSWRLLAVDARITGKVVHANWTR